MADKSEDTAALARREHFKFLTRIATRWMDNDVYGHINNVVYYSYFDTLINKYSIDSGALDIHDGAVIGLAVETHCRFLQPLSFPQDIDAALRVAHLGTSSVRYEIGLFAPAQDEPAALGWFVHVFVDRKTRRPQPMSNMLRLALSALLV
jgi:acyl-CoA thioester hydrolase